MRHRDETDQAIHGREFRRGTVVQGGSNALRTPTTPAVAPRPLPGKHRAPVAAPRIPTQALPIHDTAIAVRAASAVRAATAPVEVETVVPHSARWKARHLPHTVVATVLVLAAVGTAALGARYAQTRSSDDIVALALGLGVVVVLWAVVIVSTPQVVTLAGSVLTVHNTGGSESFDLSDSLQPVDVVGNPRTSHWAVLLHRTNSTTVVLRRHDVNAAELDLVVRHYRMVADQCHTDRDARFNR